MKRLLRSVNSATEISDAMKDKMDDIKEDYDYVIAGVEKLVRIGKSSEANDVLSILDNALQECISSISDII